MGCFAARSCLTQALHQTETVFVLLRRPLDYGVPKDPRLRSAPAFTFHGTNIKEDPDRVPGPGAYAWGKSHAATRASAPQFSLGLKCEDPAMRDRR